MKRPGFVLLHGAWAGAWVWDSVAPQLRAKGHLVVVPDLPGGNPGAESTTTLSDMVAHVLTVLPLAVGPWIVVGHSGGGIVATMVAEALVAAKASGGVAGLVYLAGMMLPSGMTFPEICQIADVPPPQGIEPFLRQTADGRATWVPPAAAAEIFFHCAGADESRAAAARLCPQLDSSWMIVPRWTKGGAGSVPRLYIEALQDRSIPISVQRAMQRLVPGARSVSLDTDHAPQLSCPDRVALTLLDFATQVRI